MLALWDGKKKKGRIDKRGNKKKEKWGRRNKKKPSQKAPPPEALEEKPPTPPTFAYLHKFTFENENDFFNFMVDNKMDKPIYVLFCYREADYEKNIFDEEDKPDEAEEVKNEEDVPILEVEEWMELCLFGIEQHHLSRDICFMVVHITPKQFQDCHAFNHPATQLKILPTLMRWGSMMRLEGEECLSEDALYLFFSREVQHNSKRFVDDGSVNPFYTPPPPEPTPPPTPPPPKKEKNKKGKKGKKDKKGKNVKGKKGKGKKGKKK